MDYIIGLRWIVRWTNGSLKVRADQIHPVQPREVSAYELIIAMNTLRVSYGLPALTD